MPQFDVAKWEAFRHVKVDDAERLAEVLNASAPEVWMAWRNFAGKTMYQVAEKESNRKGSDTRCLQLLRERLQSLDLVPQQVPRVDFVDSVVEVPQVLERTIEVPVPEIHYHKTLKHVPNISVTEVPEVLEVPQVTWKEELVVVPERQTVPKEVPHTTITQRVKFEHTYRTETLPTEEIGMELALPPVPRRFERPVVDLDTQVRLVRGKEHVFNEKEEISVPHELFVPKTEVKIVNQTVVRPKELIVPHIIERAERVQRYEEEIKHIEQRDTTLIQEIRYVPKLPMKTEWVRRGTQGRVVAEPIADFSRDFSRMDTNRDGVVSREEFIRAGGSSAEFDRIDADHSGGISRTELLFDRLDTDHDGVITRAELERGLSVQPRAANCALDELQQDMWYELNMLRTENSHLVKRNSRFKEDLDRCMMRLDSLRLQLEQERRLRKDREHEVHDRGLQQVCRLSLAPLPVRTESSFEVDRLLSTPSTVMRSTLADLSSIASPERHPRADLSNIGDDFDRMDANGDGMISRAEFMFDRLDRNHDGVITRDEFALGMGGM